MTFIFTGTVVFVKTTCYGEAKNARQKQAKEDEVKGGHAKEAEAKETVTFAWVSLTQRKASFTWLHATYFLLPIVSGLEDALFI